MKPSHKHWIPAFAGMTKKYLPAFAGMTLLLVFSFWLMFHTFSYDAKSHSLVTAFKLWSDFGAHIPMIRSFSMGDNFTRFFHGRVEYPIFPGEPIRYHFLFYMLVGLLERLGLRIDWALNIPSALGFFFLLITIYTLAMKLFEKRSVAILSLVFFLCNGSLGFLQFLKKHPLSTNILRDIVQAKDFPAFAPWGPGWVTAFWNLNIYTNQRHLAIAFALVILFILTCLYLNSYNYSRPRIVVRIIAWSIIIGLLPYFHQPTLLILAVIMLCYFLVFPRTRLFLFTTGILSLLFVLPQLYLMPEGAAKAFEWYPGFILHNELTLKAFLLHWGYNLGLHAILIPIGFILLPSKTKKFFLPLIPLFLIPNLFKFSVEVSANHKFFNLLMIMGGMLSAYVIIWIFDQAKRTKKRVIVFLITSLVSLIALTLTLSGVIDFFVIANDTKGKIPDVVSNEVASWIARHTPPDAVFLNSQYLYHPASLAGRAIFLGWPYFAWSAGYKENRMPIMDQMYEGRDPVQLCALFQTYHISYITVEDVKNDTNLPTIDLSYYLKKYTPVFLSKNQTYAIFPTTTLCSLHP